MPLLFRDAIKVSLPAEEQFPVSDGCRGTEDIVKRVHGQHFGHFLTVTHDLRDSITAGDIDSAGGADRGRVHVGDGLQPKWAALVIPRLDVQACNDSLVML